jgi:DNA repair protein radc
MPTFSETKPDVREQVLKHGLQYPSDEELVMLILGTGIKDLPIRKLARDIVRLLNETNSRDVVRTLSQIRGMGTSRSLAIASAIELGRRRSVHLHSVIKTPKDVVPFIRNYSVQVREHFVCVTLNGGHEILNIRVASVGTLNRTLVHPREVFSEALIEHASAVIVCHNHPAGSCTPSQEDIETTQILIAASHIIGITLLDHIILDRDSYFSFLEHRLLFTETE